MQICAVEYTQNKSHVAVVRSIRIAMAETNNINGLQDFFENAKTKKIAFRYVLDTFFIKNFERLSGYCFG